MMAICPEVMVPSASAAAQAGNTGANTSPAMIWRGPEVSGGRDPARGFLAGRSHPGGRYIGPGFPADLMGGGPVHQCGLDAVIDHFIGAGVCSRSDNIPSNSAVSNIAKWASRSALTEAARSDSAWCHRVPTRLPHHRS